MLLLIKVFAVREMGITAEQEQGGTEARGDLYPLKAQTAVTIQGFSHQRCAQGAGFETWEPLPPGSVNIISHSDNTIGSSDKGSRAAAGGGTAQPQGSTRHFSLLPRVGF